MDKVIQYIEKNKWIVWVFFALCFWLVIVHLHLNRGLSDMIPGYHYWRKTDTYAQILNYYHNGFNFFDHSIYFNQMESGGKAVAEFPLFYYLVALQLKIFGNHLIILKINWLIVMFFGHFALFKTAYLLTKNYLASMAVAFVLFLAPVYVIYCIEFLPDPIALHLSFVGMYFLTKYFLSPQKSSRFLALLFITMSGLIKPFFLVPYLAFLLIYLIYTLVQRKQIKLFLAWLIPLGFVALWFYYTKWYNLKTDNNSFLSSILPIWADTGEHNLKVWNQILSRWITTYFSPFYAKVIFFLAILSVIYGAFKARYMSVFLFLSYAGAFCFVMLFFSMFEHHDYYFYPVLFLAPLTVLVFFYALKKLNINTFMFSGISILFLLGIYIGSYGSWYARKERLMNPAINASAEFKDYLNLDAFLTRKGVSKDDFIVTFSDKSPTYALLLLNRKGWSGYQTFYRQYTLGELADLGAKYVVINKNLPPQRDSLALTDVELNYIADTNGVYVYKIGELEQ